MKRFSLLSILTISLALSVAGCGPAAPTPSPEKSEAAKKDMTKVQAEMVKKAAQGATSGRKTPP